MSSDDLLQGSVRQEVFRRDDGGFAVLMVEAGGRVVSVTGPLPVAHPGEVLEARGEWVMDPRFGRQFRAREARVAPPDSPASLERYLASGAIAGVGPSTARRIVERFGEDTVRVLDEEPEALRQVKGIGKKRLRQITESWAQQRATREAVLFLRGHGVGPVLAERIHARYGADTRRVIDEDPYQLAREIDGVGFLTADRIARALGMAEDDPRRARAGLLHVVTEALQDGHVAVPVTALLETAARLLHARDAGKLEEGLRTAREHLELELDRPPRPDGAPGEEEVVYLPQVLRAERSAAQRTAQLVRAARRRVPVADVRAAVAWLAERHGLALTEAQAEAVQACLEAPLVVITGGPGVGKTTVLRALVRVLTSRGARFALAAPTGRAAKRMEEATGEKAMTLHRLLGWDPTQGGFQKDTEDPLDVDLLVVDESSMVDVRLYHALVRALPAGATLVLTGDADQLPSVGPGAVLADLIASGAARVVRLTEVFRQAASSYIVRAAHAINAGQVPDLVHDAAAGADFFFVARDDPLEAQRAIVKLVTERIPARFGLDPFAQVQVLSPMRKGACGTDALNAALRAALLGADAPADLGRLEPGDKVMQLKNDYENDVYNGDLGRVVRREEDGRVVVAFDGREVAYARNAASNLALSYCATIHKAQGSEYAAVVVPVLTEHYVMLERNLLYTALTRARKLAVLVGQRRAIEMAVGNDRPRQRVSFLAGRVRAAL